MRVLVLFAVLLSLGACAGYEWNSQNPDFRKSGGGGIEPGEFQPNTIPPK